MNHILYIEKQYIALQKICHVIQMDRSAYRLFRSQTRQRVAVGVCDLRNANAVPADRVILPQRIQRHFHHLIAISRRTLIIRLHSFIMKQTRTGQCWQGACRCQSTFHCAVLHDICSSGYSNSSYDFCDKLE